VMTTWCLICRVMRMKTSIPHYWMRKLAQVDIPDECGLELPSHSCTRAAHTDKLAPMVLSHIKRVALDGLQDIWRPCTQSFTNRLTGKSLFYVTLLPWEARTDLGYPIHQSMADCRTPRNLSDGLAVSLDGWRWTRSADQRLTPIILSSPWCSWRASQLFGLKTMLMAHTVNAHHGLSSHHQSVWPVHPW
jgi:hypothetical protein